MPPTDRFKLSLILQHHDGRQADCDIIEQNDEETLADLLKRGAAILDVGWLGRGLLAKDPKPSEERRNQVALSTGERQFRDGDRPEFCASCREHISRHFGGTEYRCDPRGDESHEDEAALFSRRPRTVKPCSRCEGKGEETVGYALAHLPTRDPRLPDYAVQALVVGAATIFEATREARAIADQCRRPVAFMFLQHPVQVGIESDTVQIARDWWRRQYGETPEQTQARR